ncbi:vWA domain-containing protein [Bacillus niameyensis]|uniref:vWA domain-containing protein n=1 Tax=Bacillus niameyensis TaxID=1522308 RepID=UPI000783355C|nr:VWA domain-containing protein [Bacillus niameyensis]
MAFLNPAFFSLFIFVAAVLVFYMFRKQYESIVIPSTFLWEQVMNEWQASPWLNKLQRNLLLFLQLLILILLMFALVRPYFMVKGIAGEHIFMIIDTSASMAAIHNGNTRFSEAKAQMDSYLEQVDGQEITLITAGSEPKLVINKEKDISLIKQSIKDLNISYEYSDVKKAIRLAASLASQEDASFFVFSDSVIEADIHDLPENSPITVINNGNKGSNISLKSFGTGIFNDETRAVAVIENQSDEPATVKLQVQTEDQLFYEQEITIDPAQQKFMNIESLPSREYYKARILVDDDYKVDNELIAIHKLKMLKVYALGEVSPFIIRGLENIGYEVIQLKGTPDEQDIQDGIVVTENLAVQNWPKRPVLAITPETGDSVKLQEKVETTNDPLFQYVDIEKAYIESANSSDTFSIPVIAKSGSLRLIQKGTIDGLPAIVIHFSLEDSDWPLHPSFPIFLYHSAEWLTSQDTFIDFFQPGEERWMNANGESGEWNVFNEEGKFVQSYNLNEESFIAPEHPGLYQLMRSADRKYFAVNLDEREKTILSEPSFSLNQETEDEDSLGNLTTRPYEQIWFWFVLLAILIMFIEWEVTRRGSRV